MSYLRSSALCFYLVRLTVRLSGRLWASRSMTTKCYRAWYAVLWDHNFQVSTCIGWSFGSQSYIATLLGSQLPKLFESFDLFRCTKVAEKAVDARLQAHECKTFFRNYRSSPNNRASFRACVYSERELQYLTSSPTLYCISLYQSRVSSHIFS